MIAAYRELISYIKAQQALTPTMFTAKVITPADTAHSEFSAIVHFKQLGQDATLGHLSTTNNDMLTIELVGDKKYKQDIFKAIEWLDSILTGKNIAQTSPQLCGDIFCHTMRVGMLYTNLQGLLVLECSWSLLTKQEYTV